MLEEYSITLDDITSIITALVALSGLGLSIYNLNLRRKDKEIQLKSKLSNGFIPHGPDIGDLMLLLEVTNPGEITATINSVELLWKDKTMAFIHGIPGTKTIPFELETGKNAVFWTPAKEVSQTLKQENVSGKVKLRANFKTAIGTEHESKPFKLDIDEWA